MTVADFEYKSYFIVGRTCMFRLRNLQNNCFLSQSIAKRLILCIQYLYCFFTQSALPLLSDFSGQCTTLTLLISAYGKLSIETFHLLKERRDAEDRPLFLSMFTKTNYDAT